MTARPPKPVRITVTVTWPDGSDRVVDLNIEQLTQLTSVHNIASRIRYLTWCVLQGQPSPPTP